MLGGGSLAYRASPGGYSVPAEQGGQGAKGSVDRTLSLPPAPSCAYPAEHGTGGDGPQRRLF